MFLHQRFIYFQFFLILGLLFFLTIYSHFQSLILFSFWIIIDRRYSHLYKQWTLLRDYLLRIFSWYQFLIVKWIFTENSTSFLLISLLHLLLQLLARPHLPHYHHRHRSLLTRHSFKNLPQMAHLHNHTHHLNFTQLHSYQLFLNLIGHHLLHYNLLD